MKNVILLFLFGLIIGFVMVGLINCGKDDGASIAGSPPVVSVTPSLPSVTPTLTPNPSSSPSVTPSPTPKHHHDHDNDRDHDHNFKHEHNK